MDAKISLFSVVLLLGAAHGVFLALALVHARQGNRVAHRILAVITLVFALDLIGEFLYQTHYYYKVPYLIWLDDPLEFLYGPLALIFVQVLTRPNQFVFNYRLAWHLLPVVLAALIGLPFYTLDHNTKLALIYGDTYTPSFHAELAEFSVFILLVFFSIQVLVYLILGIYKLVQHARRIRQTHSYIERINLAWLRNFYVFLVLLYVLFVLDIFIVRPMGLENKVHIVLYLTVVIMFYVMAYLELRQPTIFSDAERTQHDLDSNKSEEVIDPVQIHEHEITRTKNEKYKTSALDADTSRLFLDELTEYMETEKPYLDSRLTLPQLASRLGLSTNYLSQIINEQLEINFFDFVNGYRIEEAKKRLVADNEANKNVLTIALDSGFNSKTAFYTAFKKNTGMTPKQFRKHHYPPA